MDLLKKCRDLMNVFQESVNSEGFQETANQLSDTLKTNVYILNSKGYFEGYACYQLQDNPLQEFIEANAITNAINVKLLNIRDTLVNISAKIDQITMSSGLHKNQELGFTTIIPIRGRDRIGTLILTKISKYQDEDLVLAEFLANLMGVEMLRRDAQKIFEERQERKVLVHAVNSLSHSELEAARIIFTELNALEGLLVASKIADRTGITRSVIVNCLRKLESGGIVESRSLGMKGTYIKILNDQLLNAIMKKTN